MGNSHADPQGRASQLIRKWAATANFAELPLGLQASLQSKSWFQSELVQNQCTLEDDTCIYITRGELLYAVKKRENLQHLMME